MPEADDLGVECAEFPGELAVLRGVYGESVRRRLQAP